MGCMGIWKKLLGAADKVYDAKTDLETRPFRDRRYERAEALAATGDPHQGVVTGIKRRLNDSTTTTDVRIEWFAPEPRVGGLHLGDEMPLVVRLGSTVAIKTEGDVAVLDPAAMNGVAGDPGRKARQVPDQGVDDRALDSRVLSRLKKWVPQDATVESFEQVRVMGMLAQNWDIVVTCADGTRATVRRDNVPSYARWFVAPGAVVPVVVDPKDAGRAQVDWPELAERAAVVGGTWQDPPSAGSIAASLLGAAAPGAAPTAAPATAEQVTAASMGEGADPTPSAESADAIEGVTVEQCAAVEAALSLARISPAEYDGYAAANLGVPAGRWGAIRSGWEARQRADWRVGAAYGAAYEAAMKDLKKRR